MEKTVFDLKFLTVDQLCEYLTLKRSTIYSLVESGALPHYRIGRLIRFKKDDVDRWMEAHRRESIDMDKKARDILKAINRPSMDVDRLVKKSIEQTKGLKYIPNSGKPDSKGLRKEVEHGAL